MTVGTANTNGGADSRVELPRIVAISFHICQTRSAERKRGRQYQWRRLVPAYVPEGTVDSVYLQ